MAKSGKGGGVKGGTKGGKGRSADKGGKGKKGGGCAPGEVTLCLAPSVVKLVAKAFGSAVVSTGSDGCLAGLMMVCLDSKTATQVWATLTVALGQSGPKKKKKKGKVGSKPAGPPKTKLKGGKTAA